MESEQKSEKDCKSNKPVYIFLLCVVLILDWAALHDILKGDENIFAEYSMVALSLLLIPLFLLKIFKKV